jgi:hypothetical protein
VWYGEAMGDMQAEETKQLGREYWLCNQSGRNTRYLHISHNYRITFNRAVDAPSQLPRCYLPHTSSSPRYSDFSVTGQGEPTKKQDGSGRRYRRREKERPYLNPERAKNQPSPPQSGPPLLAPSSSPPAQPSGPVGENQVSSPRPNINHALYLS